MDPSTVETLTTMWFWSGFCAGVAPAVIIGFLLGRMGRRDDR